MLSPNSFVFEQKRVVRVLSPLSLFSPWRVTYFKLHRNHSYRMWDGVSSKENALFSLKEEEMLQGTETLTKVSGGTAGHCDGVKSGWNMPSSLCAYRNTVFV